MVTAKQFQGHPVLHREGPSSDKDHRARKDVEMVAHDHLHAFIITHGSIDLFEEWNWALIACDARAGLQIHVVHFLTWKTETRRNLIGFLTLFFFFSSLFFFSRRCKKRVESLLLFSPLMTWAMWWSSQTNAASMGPWIPSSSSTGLG